MNKLNGIAASDGIAISKAFLLVEPDLSFELGKNSDPEAEVTRLEDAISVSSTEIEQIKAKAAESLSEEEAAVFDAHLSILLDPEMKNAFVDKIK